MQHIYPHRKNADSLIGRTMLDAPWVVHSLSWHKLKTIMVRTVCCTEPSLFRLFRPNINKLRRKSPKIIESFGAGDSLLG